MIASRAGITGGGEMGRLIGEFPWPDTVLGDMEEWPQSLVTIVNVIIHSRFPMFLFWGPDLLCFYNDAYRPSLGEDGKHPSILGQPAIDSWSEIWHIIKPLIDQVMAGGESTWREDQLIPIFRNNKIEDVYWTFSYSPVFDDSGERAGVLVTCAETTDRVLGLQKLKESKKKLLDSEYRFRTLVMEAPVAMAVFEGPNFVTRIANPFVLEFWGRTLEEVINRPLFEALPDAAGQGFEQLLTTVLETGETYVASELPVTLMRKGQLVNMYINFIYQCFDDDHTEQRQIIVVATEVTNLVIARKMLEQTEEQLNNKVNERTHDLNIVNGALLLSNTELEKVNENLQEFAFAASHDLKEPVRKMLFYSDLIKSDLSLPVSAHLLEFNKLIYAAQRMGKLIDNILTFSQVGNQLKDVTDVDLSAVIGQVRDDLEMLITERKVIFRDCLLPVIRGNSYQMHQVFQNIVVNAIKFQGHLAQPLITISGKLITGKEGPFELTAEQMEMNFCLLTFIDNGIGFNREYADSIFKIFVRLEERSAYPGTGIGLSIVKKIIDNHKGYIQAVSEIGKGATFQILLPII